MPLKIEKDGEGQGKKPKAPLVADRRLYLDHSKERLVEEGAEDAAYLLAGAGGMIPGDVAADLGLKVVDGKVSQPKAPKATPDERIGSRPSPPVVEPPAPRAPRQRKPKGSAKPKE